MKAYCKYPSFLLGGKFNFTLPTYHIFFVITDCSNISFLFIYLIIFVREANRYCMYLIIIPPSKFILLWFCVISMQISTQLWKKVRINCMIVLFFRAAQVQLCILCLSLLNSTEAETVLTHSSGTKLWAFTCHWTFLWNYCCSQQGRRGKKRWGEQ